MNQALTAFKTDATILDASIPELAKQWLAAGTCRLWAEDGLLAEQVLERIVRVYS